MADTIKINNKDYDVESLPRDVQTMVGMYRRWESELTEAKLEAAKVENALQNLGGQIIRAVETPTTEQIADAVAQTLS